MTKAQLLEAIERGEYDDDLNDVIIACTDRGMAMVAEKE